MNNKDLKTSNQIIWQADKDHFIHPWTEFAFSNKALLFFKVRLLYLDFTMVKNIWTASEDSGASI